MDGHRTDGDLQLAREEAISYAAYRIIRHRFATSPGAATTLPEVDALMSDARLRRRGHLDRHVAPARRPPSATASRECYIAYGLQDGANEANGYANQHYLPVNPPIEPPKPGNPAIVDLDRWQPIALVQYVDQAGNVYNSNPPALSPEWGAVLPFALTRRRHGRRISATASATTSTTIRARRRARRARTRTSTSGRSRWSPSGRVISTRPTA